MEGVDTTQNDFEKMGVLSRMSSGANLIVPKLAESVAGEWYTFLRPYKSAITGEKIFITSKAFDRWKGVLSGTMMGVPMQLEYAHFGIKPKKPKKRGGVKTMAHDPVHIVVVGSTGVGKSTLCNFLTQTDSFLTSSSLDSETKEISSAKTHFGTKEFVFIDTPGLNEPVLADELKNIRKFLQDLQKFKYLSAVIFVSNSNTRFDDQTIRTFTYYHHLFQDIIRSDNFFCVQTNVPDDFFQENLKLDNEGGLVQLGSELATRIEMIKKKLKNLLDLEACHFEFVNLWKAKLEEPSQPGRYTIYDHSHQARKDILRSIDDLVPCQLSQAHFRLPPHVQLVFRSALKDLELERGILLRSNYSGTKVADIQALYGELEESNKKQAEIELQLIELEKKRSLLVREKSFVTGRGIRVLSHLIGKSREVIPRKDAFYALRLKLGKDPVSYFATVKFISEVHDVKIEDELNKDIIIHFSPIGMMFRYQLFVNFTLAQNSPELVQQLRGDRKKLVLTSQHIHEQLFERIEDPKVGVITKFLEKYPGDLFSLSEMQNILNVFVENEVIGNSVLRINLFKGETPTKITQTKAPSRALPPRRAEKKAVQKCKALDDFEAQEEGDLDFKKGDLITILEFSGDWWTGELNGKKGVFPSNFTKMV